MQSDILEIIKANPGILETDLMKMLTICPTTAYRQIRSLDRNGKIRKVKFENTFKLSLP